MDGGDTITVNVTINPRNDAPVNTAAPTVSGTLHVGQMLTAGTGIWNDSADLTPGTITFSYQWQRADDATGSNAVDIVGATTTAYTVIAADNFKCLRFRVTATDDGEGLPATSATTVSTEWQPVTNLSPAITEGTMTSVTLDEDSSPAAFSLTLHATDGDGDTLTWIISSAASHGNATVATGTGPSQIDLLHSRRLDYNTAAGGAESFVVEVSDGLERVRHDHG
ncbi:MAG: Ig-like domain-containing protein [Candidatus Moduliflexus flocculans]|nr:Ig-like domain-containing protein [Candidatus Moduliflexus flocculans]